MSLAPKHLANFPAAVPDSAGIPKSVRDEVVVAPYNDLEAVRAAFAAHGPSIAAIITEAAAPILGVLAPDLGFTTALAAIAHYTCALLLLDEGLTR